MTSEDARDHESPGDIARAAGSGALALGVRQIFVQGSNIVGAVLLARLLSPAEFGIYAILIFLLAFLVTFGDVGLGASLIRQARKPSLADYRAIFTVQLLLVTAVCATVWMLAPLIAEQYQRSPGEAWLFRLLGLSLVIVSLRTVPVVRMERELAFRPLAMVEVAQALVFNGMAVGLALGGWGATSVAVAIFTRCLVGAILANLVAPWRIGLRWDWPRVRAHLGFGLPYQGIGVVSLIKDSINPVFIGFLLGTSAVGYINWAEMVAAFPVLVLMALQRVYLPAFSRMSSHPEALGPFVERVVGATNALVAPLALLTLVLIQPLTVIVFGAEWTTAVPLFFFFWAANLFVPTATPLLGLLNALGRADTAFRFALLWMAGTWLLGVPLILVLGPLGFAVANVVVQLTNLYLFRVVGRQVDFRLLRSALPSWGVASVAGMVVFLLVRTAEPTGLAGLAGYFALGATVYIILLGLLNPTGTRRLKTWLITDAWRAASRSY